MTNRWLNRSAPVLALAGALVAAPALSYDRGEAEAVLAQLAAGGIDRTGAVKASNFRLRSGLAVIHLDDGILVPARPVGERPVEFVFVGAGRVEVTPPDVIEAGQLELFTGAARLTESFRQAVFVIARDEAVAALARLPGISDDPRLEVAIEAFGSWRASTERSLLDVEARLLADAVGSPLAGEYFCGAFEGLRLGRFLYVVDPLAEEQVTLGQFARPELTRSEQRAARRHLERSQREGKLIGIELADLGTWDTWMSTALSRADGVRAAGATGVEPERYGLDATLRGPELELEAVARIDLRVVADGLRTVTLGFAPELMATAVNDGSGRSLPFHRSRGELTAVLAEPLARGSTMTIEVRYTTLPFERSVDGAYVLRRTLGWYPRAGIVDRAAYDVTIRWPEPHQLYGSGRVVAAGVDDGGVRWQRRRLDARSLGFSFEVGSYEVITEQVGHILVTVAIDPTGPGTASEPAQQVLESVRDALGYFEQVFGAYPLDELVVVSAPRTMSQGLLGFITLGTPATEDWQVWGEILGLEDRRTIIAHEVAHQWWGNLVGWSSYRDQWISEAMANYSAVLYARNRLRQSGDAVRNSPTRGWQGALLATTAGGRTVESIGPVVLGTRLRSSVGGGAYRSVVYQKGAVVLDMLSRFFTEELFLKILREVVGDAAEHSMSTEDFLSMVERIGGADLEWFRRQYVYGTGLPEVEYESRFERRPDGGWVVQGEARQRAPYHFHYRVERRPDGTHDVRRRADERLDVARSVLAVPVQIGVVAPSEDPRAGSDAEGPAVLVGTALLQGATSSYRFELAQQPEIVWLDRDHEVFGRFFGADTEPMAATYQRGLDQAAAGHMDRAEQTLLAALTAEVARYPEGWRRYAGDSRYQRRLLEGSIQLALARLYLDRDRDAAAAARLKAAKAAIPDGERRRFEADTVVLEGRLDLRAGQAQAALKRLRRALLIDRRVDSAESWALLAAAADGAGAAEDLRLACDRALRLGVDLSVLACPAAAAAAR